ncbi:uncharacterized protein PHACADRAFT_207862 [Phanerochaete carnosa HHB-10118-sp]|uniref:FHA domain-containing protein n=1 Tax=Phanerochaete carnosa (strain HHB-10118-sp) TaxID=650164 RepID=K5WBS1_PHACS|nr:uncharacterized protein PHACADRAFT_207862 [Phanerochaete carnosa HHB-10118-sp]EKM56665.1 hypothetical protein PHACADRAFT_207862 [Phanerochaete carnosa HHB-10118-sp]
MDASEVGIFGTLRLMKRLEPDKVVASYPIDDEEITFGRDPTCSIRLYYESVSGLHCKMIFRERKAFLVVLGVNGIIVDACPVFPATDSSSGPVTVPLPNNSSIEIHKKRFQFSYPPKELRETLINTPAKQSDSNVDRRRRRRTLRMSMIQSAQVFTPRPSHDPRENLRILKTPIKSPFTESYSPAKRRVSSPLKRGAYIPEEIEEEEEDENIVLVESNHPRVVEEDRDLVILEHVVVREPEPEPEPEQSQQQTAQYPIPPSAQPSPQAMQTPIRQPRSSLHRAVLLRSAHRTALRREMEMEDEKEAEEVEEIFERVEQMQDLRAEDDEDDENNEAQEEQEQQEQQQETSRTVSGWRKSLDIEGNEEDHEQEQTVPEAEFAEGEEPEETPASEPDDEQAEYEEYEEEYQQEVHEDDEDTIEVEEEEESQYEPPMPPPAMPSRGPFAVPQKPLGKFMTPQAPRQIDFGGMKSKSRSHVRYSVGGFTTGGIYGTGTVPSTPGSSHGFSGPRRVRVVEPWKVDEITVPLNDAEEQKEETQQSETSAPGWPATPRRNVPLSPSKRERLSEEERKAIIQRRKSLLTEPDFFGGQTPGRRLSLHPPLSPMKSPTKALASFDESLDPSSSTSNNTSGALEEGNREDTSILLARMKHMVEDAKRRQSVGPRASLASRTLPMPRKSSGGFSLLAPETDSTPVRQIFVEDARSDEDGEHDEEEDVSDKENGGAAPPVHTQTQELSEEEHDQDVHMASGDKNVHPEEQPRFKAPYPKAAIETPRMDGLKHMFGASRTEVATPSLRGVREMFKKPAQSAVLETPGLKGARQMFARAEGIAAAGSSRLRGMRQEVPSTPVFEGVSEMLQTPSGYGATAQTESEPEQEDEIEQGVEAHDEQHEGEEEETPIAKPRSRKSPSKQKTPITRRTSPRNAPPPGPTIEEPSLPAVDEEEAGPAPTKRGSRTTRGKAPENDAEPEIESAAARPRRTRKTTASPAPGEEEPGTAPRTRRARTKTPTPQPEDARATATRSRRRARTPIAEADEEEADANTPPDSVPRAPSPEVPPPPEAAPARSESKVRRAPRSRFVLEVKEEEEEEDVPTLPAKRAEPGPAARGSGVPRAVRGRRPAGAAAATAASLARTSSIPRSAPAAGRGTKATATAPTSTLLRRPATVPSAKQGAVAESAAAARNKENTPSGDDEEPERPAARTASKIARVGTRTVAGRTRAASVDQPEKPGEVGKSRVSRSKGAATRK